MTPNPALTHTKADAMKTLPACPRRGKPGRARAGRLAKAFDAACDALADRAAARLRVEQAFDADDCAAYEAAWADMNAAAAKMRLAVLLYERLAPRTGVPRG